MHEQNLKKKIINAGSKNDNTSNAQQCNYHHIESFDEAL